MVPEGLSACRGTPVTPSVSASTSVSSGSVDPASSPEPVPRGPDRSGIATPAWRGANALLSYGKDVVVVVGASESFFSRRLAKTLSALDVPSFLTSWP